MVRWLDLTQAAARATKVTSQEVSPDEIIELAVQGVVRLGARIPRWESPGHGELNWLKDDGSKATTETDGVARWIIGAKLDTLQLHGRVSLAGIRWSLDCESNFLTAGPTSPFIECGDLRILDSEVARIVAVMRGDPLPPRDRYETSASVCQEEVRPSTHSSADLLQRWQELAAKVVTLREKEPGLVPTELEAAIRLRISFEKDLHELEATSDYQAELRRYIAYLEDDLASTTDAVTGLRLKAQINSWRAHLLRIAPNMAPDATVAEPLFEPGEPLLKQGRNPRSRFEEWVHWAAGHLYQQSDHQRSLAEKIRLRAEKQRIESERGLVTTDSIIKMLPSGLTGPRGTRPVSRSKK